MEDIRDGRNLDASFSAKRWRGGRPDGGTVLEVGAEDRDIEPDDGRILYRKVAIGRA